MQIINRGFGKYSNEGIVAFASNIIISMGEEPAATYYSLEEHVQDLEAALGVFQVDISRGNAPGAADARTASRGVLTVKLDNLVNALEIATPGDRAKLGTTGYELHKIREADPSPTGIPQDVRVVTTGNPGEAKLVFEATPHAVSYEGRATKEIATGVYVECPPSSDSRKLLFTGLERGVEWFFQVRALGPNGLGPWSDVAMMMVV